MTGHTAATPKKGPFLLPKTDPQKAKVHSQPSPFAAPFLASKTEPKKGPFSSKRSLPTLAARAVVAPIPPLRRACGYPALPQTPCKARRKLPALAQTPYKIAATTCAPHQDPAEKYAPSLGGVYGRRNGCAKVCCAEGHPNLSATATNSPVADGTPGPPALSCLPRRCPLVGPPRTCSR